MALVGTSGPGEFSPIQERSRGSLPFSTWSFFLICCAEAVHTALSCLSGAVALYVGVSSVCSWEGARSESPYSAILGQPPSTYSFYDSTYSFYDSTWHLLKNKKYLLSNIDAWSAQEIIKQWTCSTCIQTQELQETREAVGQSGRATGIGQFFSGLPVSCMFLTWATILQLEETLFLNE